MHKQITTMKMKKIIILTIGAMTFGCSSDFLEKKPVDQIPSDLVMVDESSANQVVNGFYNALQNGNAYGKLEIGIKGVSSDELISTGRNPDVIDLDRNNCTQFNGAILDYWNNYYSLIYRTNFFLEKISAIAMTQPNKNKLVGQAMYVRALSYLNLVSIFGGVPLAKTSDLSINRSLHRSSTADCYNFIIEDLTSSAGFLKGVDYGDPGRDPEDARRAGEWAAKALLARVQLYNDNLPEAKKWADDVITNGGYTLVGTYKFIFFGGSSETIFELYSDTNHRNGLHEQLSPQASGNPEYKPSQKFIDMVDPFRSLDLGDKYSEPTNPTIVSRLAEMYLIRAEASLGTPKADDDLNLIRNRVSLAPKDNITLTDILDERFLEFCFEGHRWNDLIRTKTADGVMKIINPTTWNLNKVLLPIPFQEIARNPSLKDEQNPGYN